MTVTADIYIHRAHESIGERSLQVTLVVVIDQPLGRRARQEKTP